jgi:hypothetical protein
MAPLPDEAVVVRAGVMASFEDVRESAETNFRTTRKGSGKGIYGISVCSLPDRSMEEIMRDIPEDKRFRNRRVRQSTVGTLRREGYDVLPSGWFGHATLTFPSLPTEEDWERLQEAFMDDQQNPYRRTE